MVRIITLSMYFIVAATSAASQSPLSIIFLVGKYKVASLLRFTAFYHITTKCASDFYMFKTGERKQAGCRHSVSRALERRQQYKFSLTKIGNRGILFLLN